MARSTSGGDQSSAAGLSDLDAGDAEPQELPPIHRSSRPGKASFILAETIMQDIVGDKLWPGDPLPPEREMVEKYQLGRTTVREALRLLEYQGAIVIRPGLNGGPFVRSPDSHHFSQTISFLMRMERAPFESVVEVRAAIEPMVCRLAAERITEVGLAELERTLTEMRQIINDPEETMMPLFSELNARFHSVIAWSSGNTIFHHMSDSLHDIIDGGPVGISYSKRSLRGLINDHQAIFDALSARDADLAAEQMAKHLQEWEIHARRKSPEALRRPIP